MALEDTEDEDWLNEWEDWEDEDWLDEDWHGWYASSVFFGGAKNVTVYSFFLFDSAKSLPEMLLSIDQG